MTQPSTDRVDVDTGAQQMWVSGGATAGAVETKLNGVDVLRVRPEGRFGLPIEPPSE